MERGISKSFALAMLGSRDAQPFRGPCSSRKLVAYFSYKIKLTRTAKGIGFLSKSGYYPGYYATLVRNLYFRHHQLIFFVLNTTARRKGCGGRADVNSSAANQLTKNSIERIRLRDDSQIQRTLYLISACEWVRAQKR